MTGIEAKAQLRTQLAGIAAAIPAEGREAAEISMRERLLALPEITRARGVLVCLSYGIEPETRPLIQALVDAGKRVSLPRADRGDRRLHVHPWPCELHRLGFGLEQPARAAAAIADAEVLAEVDVAVILGLGFDCQGVRLGHGSGYVDRFLAAYPVLAIGLTFEAQLLSRLPQAAYDVPMGLVVTEDRVLRIDN